MKLQKAEKTAENLWEIGILIEPDQLREAISKVYRKDAKKYNVPGFRRGKAPRNLIEKMYGADVFLYDAVNDIFPTVYEEAIKEAGLDPVGNPDVHLEEGGSQENGVELHAHVTVRPQVKVGEYKGLKADKTVYKPDEAKVDAELERMQERNARLITREGPAQDGDITNIDYEGSVDGVPFDGGKADGYELALGSGSFIPGFEEQIVGHAAGEEFDVNVTFPEEYHSEELAGKQAVFKVKLNGVQYKEMDELNDEFAQDVSEYDTLEDLKQSLRDAQQKELDEQAERETENALVDQIVETIEGEIPEVMYEQAVDNMVRDFAFRLENQGLNLETYLQYTGMDAKAFRDGFRPQAEKQVKIRLALEAVVRLEEIATTEEDIEKEVERIAEKYQMEKEQVKNLMPSDEISKDLAVNKAIDLIKEKAKITEVEPKDEKEGDATDDKKKKPAAKKKPAKKAEKKPDETKEEAKETEKADE